MAKPARYNFISLLILFISLAGTEALAQDAPAFTLKGTYTHQLESEVNERTYYLSVALPSGYTENGSTRYPVLYLMDGTHMFPSAVAAYRYLDFRQQVENLIIVGVGVGNSIGSWQINRTLDYTPSPSARKDSSLAATLGVPRSMVKSGGAKRFKRVLSDEIIPFVESSYRSSGDRGLWGHSFGGLFAAYVLFQDPDLFDRYGLSSPSLWWQDGELFEMEAAFAGNHSALEKKVLLTAGAEEVEHVVPPMRRMAETLSRNYKGLDLHAHEFEMENHMSVIPAAITRVLKVLYAPSESYAGSAESSP